MPPSDVVFDSIRAFAAVRGVDLSDGLLREIHEELCRRVAAALPGALVREFARGSPPAGRRDLVELVDAELCAILAIVTEHHPEP